VSPRTSGAADLALAVMRADGSIVAHINDPNGPFTRSPALSFIASASATLYARVSRNDAEATLVPYDLSLSTVVQ
jgi:hypothetical protein